MRRFPRLARGAKIALAGLLASAAFLSPAVAGPAPAASPTPAAEPPTPAAPALTPIGHQGFGGAGNTANVAALGSFAYVGSWSSGDACPSLGVRVVDLSDPADPRWIATTAAYPGTTAEHVVVRPVRTPAFSGDLLVVGIQRCHGADHGGDVHEPAAPAGIAVVDVTDPARPVEIGFFDTGPVPKGVHELDLMEIGGRLIGLLAVPDSERLTGEGDLRIVDLTDPARPRQVADWGIRARLGVEEGIGCYRNVYAHSARMARDGRRAYVSYWDGGVVLLDLSDPARPRLEGRIVDDSFDGNLHSADELSNGLVLVAEEIGFLGFPSALRVSASGEAGPATVSVDVYGCEAPGASSLPVDRRIEAPLLDLGDRCAPSAARIDGAIALVQEATGRCGLADQAREAFGAGARALIIAQADPLPHLEHEDEPIPLFAADVLESLPLPVVAVGRDDGALLQSLARSGAATATLPSSRPFGGIGVWDVRNPAAPVKVGYYRTEHGESYPRPWPGGFTVHNPLAMGRFALVSAYADGVRLVDFTQPDAPVEVAAFVPPAVADPAGELPAAPLVWGVARTGSLVLASDINGGLYVLRLDGLDLE